MALLAEAVTLSRRTFPPSPIDCGPRRSWQDGKPVTPEDVIFSFDAYKANSPQIRVLLGHVTKAEKTGEREVTFTFDQPGNRELPQIVGQLTVLPKHWWEGTGPNGQQARHHARPRWSRRSAPGPTG